MSYAHQIAACIAVLAASISTASAQFETINSNTIGLRYFNDIPQSDVSVSQNSYPSILEFQENFPQAATNGGANRHIGALSENQGVSPFAMPNNTPWYFASTVRMSGAASREIGLHIGILGSTPPWNVNANTGVVMMNATSGEIAAFGGWLPFFTNFDPALSFLPHASRDQDIRLGIMVNPISPTVVTATYFINNFTVGPLSLDAGAVQAYYGGINSAGVYGQNTRSTSGPTTSTCTFRDMVVAPSPSAASALAVFIAFTARRRRVINQPAA